MIHDEDEEDDIYSAVADYRKNHPWCEVCDKCVKFDTCEHPKNGYCALFRLQAAKDMIEFNMRKPINQI